MPKSHATVCALQPRAIVAPTDGGPMAIRNFSK